MDMEAIVGGLFCMVLLFAIFPLIWYKRRRSLRDEDLHRDEEVEPLVQRNRATRRPGATRMRRRPAAATTSVATSSSSAVTEENYPDSDEDAYGADMGRPSTKKERKKQEREAQRQAEEAARESKEWKRDYYDEKRRKKDEEREAQERLLEEEALARKAKEEEVAALEFENWKGEFSVDAEGTTETDAQDGSQGLLSDFIEYIKKQKCVPLEDLAAEFKLRTQDCINRIATLESTGRLSGVMDDRGKYIYISSDEMKAVADYVKREGRVSISHLASRSNQFIDLEPKLQPLEEMTVM
ncbi:DDRGK domain-containing protein [Zostera marina]|uniref:DDRGK domain-containing protein 1 n=1 Tax=Zostera marina TaxID=29655 RepID=A0A0K9PHI9_ZOSMR|nr:DDRGK domain-containing protein [Zostera marina]